MSNKNSGREFTSHEQDFDTDQTTQHYIMTPEEVSDDTFDVMTNIVAFLKYSELRLRGKTIVYRILTILAIIAYTVAFWCFKSDMAIAMFNYGSCSIIRTAIGVISIITIGFCLERGATTKSICDEMLQVMDKEGIIITKQMEDEYRKKSSSIIRCGCVKFRINWKIDYFALCGYKEFRQ